MRPASAPYNTPGPAFPRVQPVGPLTTPSRPTDGPLPGPSSNTQKLRATRVFPIGPTSGAQTKSSVPVPASTPTGPTDPSVPKITAVGYITTLEGIALAHAKLNEAFAKNQVMVFRRDAQRTADLRAQPASATLESPPQTLAGLIIQPASEAPKQAPETHNPPPRTRKISPVRRETPVRPQSPTPDKEREIGSPEPSLSQQEELMRDLESSSSGSPTICRINYEIHDSEEEEINPGGPPSDLLEPGSERSDTTSPGRPAEENLAPSISGAGNAGNPTGLDDEAVDLRTSSRQGDETGVAKVSNKRGRPPKVPRDSESDSKRSKS